MPLVIAAHALLQSPQFATLELVSTSQPSFAMPLQSLKGALHEPTPQAPIAHPGAPLATAAQTVPHALQFIASLERLTSQPSLGFLLQSANGALHEPMAQTPCAHDATPFCAGGQALAHIPQFFGSLPLSTSQPFAGLPSQSLKAPLQVSPHLLI